MQKKLKKVLTGINWFDRITIAPDKKANDMERYRSGHNEAVLKTVCPQGRVGSNPTLSAGDTFSIGIIFRNTAGWKPCN